MHLTDRIRDAVTARNREIALEAVIELVMGVVFCAIVFGGVFIVAWVVLMFVGPALMNAGKTALYALIVTGIYALVATISAWRHVNPLENVRKLTEFEENLLVLAPVLPYGIGMQPRHASAGLAMVLIAGPRNFFEAWETWRHRLPGNETVITAAAEVLQQAADERPVEQVADAAAAMVLDRLGLIKLTGGRSRNLALTAKGRDVMRGT